MKLPRVGPSRHILVSNKSSLMLVCFLLCIYTFTLRFLLWGKISKLSNTWYREEFMDEHQRPYTVLGCMHVMCTGIPGLSWNFCIPAKLFVGSSQASSTPKSEWWHLAIWWQVGVLARLLNSLSNWLRSLLVRKKSQRSALPWSSSELNWSTE